MPSKATGSGKREQRQAEIRATAEASGWAAVGEREWAALRAQFPEVSESTLRHDLRESGVRMHPLVEGVRLDTQPDLERSLLALAECYAMEFRQQSNPMNAPRNVVLAARRKAEFVLRNPRVDAAKRAAMEEKFLWLRTWLENPLLFPAWAPLRRRQREQPQAGEAHL